MATEAADRAKPARHRNRNRSLAEERLAKGLCPNCGEEAAPYRLCHRCRFKRKIRYFLKKAAACGDVEFLGTGRNLRIRANPARRSGEQWLTQYQEAEGDDGRLKPRLRNLPIDVEKQLMQIFIDADTALTIEEVYEAWGTLRLRAGRTSAALDLAYIVTAKRDRKAKLARRAERARKQVEADRRRGVLAR